MGRYTRKPKTSGESLGVLTRSKTLALQKQQNPRNDCSNGSSSSPNSSCYLELRSRKLEKQPLMVKAGPTSPKRDSVVNSCSVGENLLESGRNTRESTPCSFIRGSSLKLQRNFPSNFEMEEFFSSAEQFQQQLFMDKYNFDPVNEKPLSGRYQWVKVDS